MFEVTAVSPRASQQGSNESLSLLHIVRALHHDVARVLDAPIAFFGLYSAADDTVEVIWQIQDGAELSGGSFPMGSGLTSLVIRSREARLVQRWSQQGPRVQVQYATTQPALPESAITVPVVVGDRVLGVFSVQSDVPGAFEPWHVQFVQDLVKRNTPRIEAALHSEQQSAQTMLNSLVARARDAAIAVDNEARLVGLNQAARTLLSLQEHCILFGYPINRPQAGHWPLGSVALTDALRPIVDRLHTQPSEPAELAIHTDPSHAVTCSAATVFDAGRPIGAVMTFR